MMLPAPATRPIIVFDINPMLTGLNHLTLAVCDVQRSVDFYQDTLGFQLAAQWSTGAYLALGELWLCLSFDKHKTDEPTPYYTHYAFSIAPGNFDAFARRLRDMGVREWKKNRSEGDSLYFLDLDGHKLEAHVGNLKTRLAQCRTQPYPGMLFFD